MESPETEGGKDGGESAGSRDELNSLDSALDTEADETTDDESQRLN